LGNALGRSLSPSSNSSWCMCFTDPNELTDGQKQENIYEKRQGTDA
jgi:hypothetical protein